MNGTRISSLLGKITILVFICCCALPAQGKYGGGSGTPDYPYLIYDANHLQAIGADANDWNKHFLMTADINMADYSYTMAVIAPDTNSSVMGFQGTPFTGTFDGNNYTIYSLKIDSNLPHSDYLGLFGQTDGNAVIENLIIKKVHITGGDYSHYLGGLCGQITEGTLIRNINIEDVNINVAENSFYIGGIVGRILDGIISDCYVSGIMSSGDNSRYIGGLCGENLKDGIIRECHSRCSVTSVQTYYIGGLCGTNYGTISKCYSSSSVTGYYLSLQFGGFCGNNRGTISNCYSTGPVTGFYNTHWAGGFCGGNSHGGIISNSYSSGFVTGYYYVGGFCAGNWQSYCNNCYWDVNTSGQLSSVGGGIGLPTEEMQTFDTYLKAGWDFHTPVWEMCTNVEDYPHLYWENFCNHKPVANADGPYSIYVGDTLTLDASGSTDDDNDIVSYMWDLDDDGSFETDAGGLVIYDVNYTSLQSLGLLVNHTYNIHLKVTDSKGQSDVNDSTLIIIPKPATVVAVDIKPGSCPNPVNVKSKGVLPVAILGLEDFDVNTIDVASIRLVGVEPIRSGYEDVATPVADANDCSCITDGPDGFLDLTLKFKTQRIVEAIGDVNDGDVLPLNLEGVLNNEIPIEGSDCIVVRGKARTLHGADINKDGVVDTADFAIFAQNWLQSSIVDE